MSTPNFAAAGQNLAAIDQQQQGLQAAVAAGELWMEADVAERAAACCDRQVAEFTRILAGTYVLTTERKFGDNDVGNGTAARFARAGEEYVAVLQHARGVFIRMAATYRDAGRAAAGAEEANQQLFRGGGQ